MTRTGLKTRTRRNARGTPISKRLVDLFVGLAALAVFWPVMALCAIWIAVVDGFPVIYMQWRVGCDGWMFRIYKFRTMAKQAEQTAGAQFASKQDPRVLWGCRWMRTSHVDELPQLWNIIRGKMSLVGPRPERPEMIEALRPHIPKIEKRLAGLPGLTGLAQIRAGYTNTVQGARRKLALDRKYLRRCSVLGDAMLMMRTVPKFWDQAAH